MIGLVTCAKLPQLSADDQPLIAELSALGVPAAPVVWNDPGVQWERFAMLVLRSAWDYHLHAAAFVDWLARLEQLGVPLWNPAPMVRWNLHKRYLRDLAARGVLIPDTEWIPRGGNRALRDVLAERGWREAIVKPAISASATDTWRAGAHGGDDARLAALLERHDVLVQEVVPEVLSAGEWSLVFIDGEYSHAMLKRPRAGDFRVQQELGGSADLATPPAAMVDAAVAITRLLSGEWLFARIDGVATARGFMLMEAECIEPLLFFDARAGSRALFARAVAERLPRG